MTWQCLQCPFTTRNINEAVTHAFYTHILQRRQIPGLDFYHGAITIDWHEHRN